MVPNSNEPSCSMKIDEKISDTKLNDVATSNESNEELRELRDKIESNTSECSVSLNDICTHVYKFCVACHKISTRVRKSKSETKHS